MSSLQSQARHRNLAEQGQTPTHPTLPCSLLARSPSLLTLGAGRVLFPGVQHLPEIPGMPKATTHGDKGAFRSLHLCCLLSLRHARLRENHGIHVLLCSALDLYDPFGCSDLWIDHFSHFCKLDFFTSSKVFTYKRLVPTQAQSPGGGCSECLRKIFAPSRWSCANFGPTRRQIGHILGK